jgi:methionyl aminopeptidase
MSLIKNDNEIKILRQGGKILSEVFKTVVAEVRPGVSTAELSLLAEKLIIENEGRPSFKDYGSPPYPSALCTSLNSEVVHGIPSEKVVLESGDLISLDLGMEYPAKNGLYTDMAMTIPVGKVSKEAKKLVKATRQCLSIIKKELKPGIDLVEIAKKVQKHVEKNGFSVVRDLVGHGVGHEVHEEPQIPNFYLPNFSFKVKEGMVLAFEPMVNIGDYPVLTKDDSWTVATQDGSLSAHFEQTIVVTADGNETLTPF